MGCMFSVVYKNIREFSVMTAKGVRGVKSWMKAAGKLVIVLLPTAIIMLALCGCTGPAGQRGPAGVGITGASINRDGHLVLTLSDGQTIDAGSVTGPQATPLVQPIGTSMTMGDLFSLLQPVIVRVDAAGSGFQAFGSGIIIRSNGYIITNAHIIDNATSITIVSNNDQQYPATVNSSDTNIDLAILKLTGGPFNLPVAVLGSASDIAVGEVVVAAGFPLGIGLPGPASFTQGVVSAVRTVNGQRYIQSDVQLNPGNSGGALIARNSGIVIGITSSAVLPQGQDIEGIGLAIPIDVVQTYIQNHLK
jgi:serine protease Do